jgi:hypothetical protein
MKKIFFLVYILAIIRVAAFSQSCLPEGITFYTQADIDSFQVNYPGCTVIEGDVNIGDFGGGGDISDLTGLIVLETVGGSLTIRENDSLFSLRGLENINTVGNSLGIVSCPGLTNLDGLEGITEVYYLGVYSNANLFNLTGLENLVTIGYGMYIYNNSSLINLSGLEGLTSVGAGLSITSNNALVSLDGLDNLATIGNGMSIEYNIALVSIAALHNLVSIHTDDHPGNLSIKANIALTSLTGLDNIEPESIVDLSIGWNTVLSTCDVYSICQYLAAPNGYVAIRYNAPGCNNQQEVEAACLEEVEEVVSRQSLVVSYPNPTDDISHFSFLISQYQWVTLKVYDLHGREVATVLDEELQAGSHEVTWNAENLPPGICFYRISTIDHRQSAIGKIVVVR